VQTHESNIIRRFIRITGLLSVVLVAALIVGLSIGSSGGGMTALWRGLLNSEPADPVLMTILWKIRLPRVLLAALVGAALSLGGLVFQALLRNPLAEPYILGISGGSAIGAIIGILIGLSQFPGVTLMSFGASLATLLLILGISMGESLLRKNALLLSGVMVNAFCSAVIMFLVSMTQDTRLHSIIFWLMGDLSLGDLQHTVILALFLVPCFIVIFMYANTMNLMLMGKEMAQSMGVHIRKANLVLLLTTSLMVSACVSQCGLIGFVGLVIPHLFRLLLGPDHRVLLPACILGGGAYMVLCDLLARALPQQGELPAGVITALVGAPLFVYLLKRSNS